MQFTVSGTKALNHGRPHINFVLFSGKKAYVNLRKGVRFCFVFVPLPGVGNRGNVDVTKRHSIHNLRA